MNEANILPMITAATAIIGSAASVAGLGWWLSGRFRKVEIAQRAQLDILAAKHEDQLDKHEQRDQERHEENLERFARISVALARLGNGGDR